MRFVTSYFSAFFRIAAVLGLVYLVLGAVEGKDAMSLYFVYIAAVAGLAGPIAEAIKK